MSQYYSPKHNKRSTAGCPNITVRNIIKDQLQDVPILQFEKIIKDQLQDVPILQSET